MNKKMTNCIIFISCFLFLILLWIIVSFFEGENGQWWSMYRLNSDEYGPWSLKLSYIKVSMVTVISIVIAYIVSFRFERNI